MTKFQQSITALIAIRNNIERCILSLYSVERIGTGVKIIERPDRTRDPFLRFTLQNYLQILLDSFTDEWSIFGGFAKDDSYVKETLKIVSPATNQFKKWSGLHKVRSGLLAHTPRDKRGELVLPWKIFKEHNSPTTFEESLLLGFSVLLAIDNVKERHVLDVKASEKELLTMDRTIEEKGIKNTSELEKGFYEIEKAIRDEEGKAQTD